MVIYHDNTNVVFLRDPKRFRNGALGLSVTVLPDTTVYVHDQLINKYPSSSAILNPPFSAKN